MTRLVWLQLELVATSLDLSWPPNSPLSPRPINTIKWISKEVLSSPCHRWRIPALDTIYAPILSSPRFLQITFPQLRMTAVTLAPFTKPISFPEAAILMYSDGGSLVTEALGTRLQWNQSQDCFSTHVTINYQFFFAHGKWVPITYFPIFDTIQYVFPRLWPFTQGVFPHLAPLDRLTGYMFSRAFYYSLTGYMSVFSRAFHHCLTGYLFSRTCHHCLIAYKLCAFRHPLSGCKFSRAFHHCLTGYMFSCAFHHGLSDYTFSNDFHHWLIGYKFTHAFHPCFTGCMFSRALYQRLYRSKFTRSFQHCLTGYMLSCDFHQ